MKEKNQEIIIYNTDDGKTSVSLMTRDGNVWLNQNHLAELFGTSKQNISLHIINILEEGELHKDSVIKDYLTTAADGKNYNVTFYSPDMIITFNKKDVLVGKGSRSNEQMERFADEAYETFNEKRKRFELQQADTQDMEELKQPEEKIGKRI